MNFKLKNIALALMGLGVISTTTQPTALENDGAVINNGALVGFLAQILTNGAPYTGNWNYATLANAAGQTLNSTNIPGGLAGTVILRSGAAAVTDTTDTAANIIASIPGAYVGMTGLLVIANTNSGTLTIAAGAGVTLAGTTTVLTAGVRFYQIKITSLTTVTLTGMFTVGASVAA